MYHRLLRTPPLAVILIAAAALACERKELAPGVNDSAFVGAMAGLRRLPASAMVDSASRARARDSVLRRFRVTGVQLESAASTLAQDPNRAAALWTAIERKINTPDTSRAPRPPRATPLGPRGVPAPKAVPKAVPKVP